MKIDEILKLVNAGYSKDEIAAFEQKPEQKREQKQEQKMRELLTMTSLQQRL